MGNERDPLFDNEPLTEPDELIAAAVDDLADLAQPTEWIVEGMLAAGSQGIWAGQPKAAKKSLLVGHLANCVARGVPFFERAVKRIPVLYVDMEQGARTMALRWRRLGRGSASGYTSDFDRGFFRTYFGLLGYLQALEIARQTKVLIIIDPLANILAQLGIDENVPAQMTKFFADLRPLLQKTGSVLLCIHHFRKSPVGRKEIDADMMRGSGSLQGIVDGWWLSGPRSRKDPNTVLVEWTNREAPGGTMCVAVSLDASIDPPFGRFIFETINEEELETSNSKRNGVHIRNTIVEALRAGELSLNKLSSTISRTKGTVMEALNPLIEDGTAENHRTIGDKRWYRLTARFLEKEKSAKESLSSDFDQTN